MREEVGERENPERFRTILAAISMVLEHFWRMEPESPSKIVQNQLVKSPKVQKYPLASFPEKGMQSWLLLYRNGRRVCVCVSVFLCECLRVCVCVRLCSCALFVVSCFLLFFVRISFQEGQEGRTQLQRAKHTTGGEAKDPDILTVAMAWGTSHQSS